MKNPSNSPLTRKIRLPYTPTVRKQSLINHSDASTKRGQIFTDLLIAGRPNHWIGSANMFSGTHEARLTSLVIFAAGLSFVAKTSVTLISLWRFDRIIPWWQMALTFGGDALCIALLWFLFATLLWLVPKKKMALANNPLRSAPRFFSLHHFSSSFGLPLLDLGRLPRTASVERGEPWLPTRRHFRLRDESVFFHGYLVGVGAMVARYA